MAFIFASHFFSPVASIFFLLPPLPPLTVSLSVTSPSLLLPPFSLCVSYPSRLSRPVFSAGVQGLRPRRVLVSQVFIKLSAVSTRTNCSSLLLNRSQILTSMLTFLLGSQSPSPQSLSPAASSACAGLREREKPHVRVCWSGRPSQKPCFLPGIIDLTNCQPCFILRK